MLCSHKPLDPANEVPARPRKPLLDRKCTESTWNLNFVCFGSKTSTLSSHHPTWLQRKTRGDPRLPFRRELHQDHIESECSLPQKPYCPVLFLVQQRTACWESAAATHCNLTDMKMPCNKNQCVKLPKKKTNKKKKQNKNKTQSEKNDLRTLPGTEFEQEAANPFAIVFPIRECWEKLDSFLPA